MYITLNVESAVVFGTLSNKSIVTDSHGFEWSKSGLPPQQLSPLLIVIAEKKSD
jgi:hypothetical protein